MNNVYFFVESSHPVVVEFLVAIFVGEFVRFIFTEDSPDVWEETATGNDVVGFHPLDEDIPGGNQGIERYPMLHDIHEDVVHVFVVYFTLIFYLLFHLKVLFSFIRCTEPDLYLIFWSFSENSRRIFIRFYCWYRKAAIPLYWVTSLYLASFNLIVLFYHKKVSYHLFHIVCVIPVFYYKRTHRIYRCEGASDQGQPVQKFIWWDHDFPSFGAQSDIAFECIIIADSIDVDNFTHFESFLCYGSLQCWLIRCTFAFADEKFRWFYVIFEEINKFIDIYILNHFEDFIIIGDMVVKIYELQLVIWKKVRHFCFVGACFVTFTDVNV